MVSIIHPQKFLRGHPALLVKSSYNTSNSNGLFVWEVVLNYNVIYRKIKLEEGLKLTVNWYKQYEQTKELREFTENQIEEYAY